MASTGWSARTSRRASSACSCCAVRSSRSRQRAPRWCRHRSRSPGCIAKRVAGRGGASTPTICRRSTRAVAAGASSAPSRARPCSSSPAIHPLRRRRRSCCSRSIALAGRTSRACSPRGAAAVTRAPRSWRGRRSARAPRGSWRCGAARAARSPTSPSQPPHVISDLRDAFGDRLYAMSRAIAAPTTCRARRACARARVRLGMPLVAANEVLYHTPRAPRRCRTC